MSDPSRPSVDIAALTQFLDSMQSFSYDLVQHLKSGQKLCHYTGLDGAIGIVRSGDLWLTSSRYSNDDQELNYGYRIVDQVLDELEKAPTPSTPPADWLRALRDELRETRKDEVYVCCFCETDNLLSQWRGYAENGGGVSLEFDPEGFTTIAGSECEHGLVRLWKVFYDEHHQRQIINNCIEYQGWPAPTEDIRRRFVVDALQFFMPTFKNSDFREEQERRLIFTPYANAVPKPQFRTRRGLLMPYFSLKEISQPGFRLPIKNVHVGPSLHRALNVESTRMLLSQYGYVDVPVAASTTPYRG